MSRKTSEAAYAAIVNSGSISRMRREVYQWLYHNGPANRNAIDRALGGGRPNPGHSRRLTELEAMGIAERVGTDGKHDLWDVTDQMPQPLPKKDGTSRSAQARAFSELAKLLRHPRALVFPDKTLEMARSIVEGVEEGAST